MILSERQIRLSFGAPCDPKNLVSIVVPVIGTLTCHRLLASLIKAAFSDIETNGLAALIKKEEWPAGGSYNCRKSRQGDFWSTHAWPLSLDINAISFPCGTAKRQDRRLIVIFRNYGFINGEIFDPPDPQHFQFNNLELLRKEESPMLDDQQTKDFVAMQKAIADLGEYKKGNDQAHVAILKAALEGAAQLVNAAMAAPGGRAALTNEELASALSQSFSQFSIHLEGTLSAVDPGEDIPVPSQ